MILSTGNIIMSRNYYQIYLLNNDGYLSTLVLSIVFSQYHEGTILDFFDDVWWVFTGTVLKFGKIYLNLKRYYETMKNFWKKTSKIKMQHENWNMNALKLGANILKPVITISQRFLKHDLCFTNYIKFKDFCSQKLQN